MTVLQSWSDSGRSGTTSAQNENSPELKQQNMAIPKPPELKLSFSRGRFWRQKAAPLPNRID